MHIEFALADEYYLKQSVKNGYFRSEAEAVRDAVREARKREEAKRERLLEALRLGDADIAAGRVTDYTPDFMEKSKQRARQMVAEGKKPKPDVIP